MKTNLVQIGNSKGIRISKSLIEQFNLEGEIEIVPSSKGLLIKPLSKPRSKWEDIFSASSITSFEKDENVEWKKISNKFDKEEWAW
jgi:antitoxin MazE